MFRHIRTKLALVMAIPLAAVVAVAGIQVDSSVQRRHTISAERALASASLGPGGLVSALQNERNEASLQLIGVSNLVHLGVSSNADARQQTAAAVAQFRATVERSGTATATYGPALGSLDGLPRIRSAADGFSGPRAVTDGAALRAASGTYTAYSTVIASLLQATSRVSPSISDPVLRTGAEILDASLRQSEAQANVVHDIFDSSLVGGPTAANGLLQATATDLGDYRAWTGRLQGLSAAPFAGAVAILTSPIQVNGFIGVVQPILAGARPDLAKLLGATAAGGASTTTAYKAATQSVASLSAARSAALDRTAEEQVGLYGLLALLVLVIGGAAVLRASHSVTLPLVRLAAQAKALADHRLAGAVGAILDGADAEATGLPPIHTKGRDEVAAVASSIAAVQQAALELAVEQATLRRNMGTALTSLGRRNQNLVTRQLDYITTVERDESDPRKLEQLFRLDHLATRMRRNAESLLVLGGAESPRQWSAPVPVVDVVRSALSEVEDFQRVTLAGLEGVAVAGRATADVAHILAEIIENSLTFSPPQTAVLVSGMIRPDGYLLSVVDRGIGMDTAALDQANARLSGRSSFTDSPSRYLGLFVAGHLSERHGIGVTLLGADGGGVRAEILLPFGLLPELAPPAPPLASPVASSAPVLAPARSAEANDRPAGAALPQPVAVEEPAAVTDGVPCGPDASPAPASALLGGVVPDTSPAAAAALLGGNLTWSPPVPDDLQLTGRASAAPQPLAPTGPIGISALVRDMGQWAKEAPGDAELPGWSAPEPSPAAAGSEAPWPGGGDGGALSLPRRPGSLLDSPVAATPAAIDPATDFERWLDSRLGQIGTASEASDAGPAAPATPNDAAGDALVRRRPGETLAAAGDGLLRRSEPAADVEPAPRVNSSLFRYLAAVEKQPSNPSTEGHS